MKKRIGVLIQSTLLSAAFLFFLLVMPVSAEDTVVYVAGNPDFYPVEYYDAKTKQYEGVMPEILKQISEKTQYQFVYVEASEKDDRMRMAKNKQVELISGYTRDEMLYDERKTPLLRESPVILEIEENGEKKQVCFAFTSIASQELGDAFTDALEEIDPKWVASVTVQNARNQQHSRLRYFVLIAGGILFVILAIVLAVFIILWEEKKRHATENMTDPVTGIGDKEYLEHFFEHSISDQARAAYAAAYIGIDTESLLERLNHQELDEILIYVADVLTRHCSEVDVAAHIQKGQFAVLLLCGSEERFQKWICSVFEEIRAYPEKYSRDCVLRVHCGVYFLKDSDKSPETILYNAQQSYRYAVEQGKDYAVGGSAILEKAGEERALRRQIQDALQKEEFQLFLQFVCTTDTTEVIGAEALVRWVHPQKGMLTPGRFLPYIEKEKRYEEVDLYMLEQSCRQLVRWKEEGKPYFLSCNFSRITASSPDLLTRMEEIFAKYDFPHENMVIEITEESLAQNREQMLNNLYKIKELGCSLALDDFGSGYASFKDIGSYPFDIVKIDKSIVDHVEEEKGFAVLDGVVKFVHSLGLKVVCEGIETKEQATKMNQINCDYLQGYYYYRPVPVREANRM